MKKNITIVLFVLMVIAFAALVIVVIKIKDSQQNRLLSDSNEAKISAGSEKDSNVDKIDNNNESGDNSSSPSEPNAPKEQEDAGLDGMKKDRLEGIIRRPNISSFKIEGVKYEGVDRGVIKTSAYDPMFKKVGGNYIITSEEELINFKLLVMDKKLNEEFLDIDFDKYTLVISAIESNTGSLIYEVNGLIVGENNIAIDSRVESPGIGTCDMARFYPYVLIEKEKLTKDAYEGWKRPSEVDSIYEEK